MLLSFTMNRKIGYFVAVLTLIAFLSGCGGSNFIFNNPYSFFIVGDANQRRELKKLYRQINEDSTSERRFIVMEQIIKILYTASEREKLNLFLTNYVETYKDDPFNGYYLLIVAWNYQEAEAYPFAVYYFERILKNYPDILVRNKSIYYICLSNLIDLVEEPEIRVNYYKDLIARFGSQVDKGPLYYELAKAYEKLGEWELSIQAYKQFLQYPDAKIPGVPNARRDVQQMIALYDYRDKNWTMESRDELVETIKHAIQTRNAALLNRYRAKVNFFAVSWEQEEFEADPEFLSGLSLFMSNRISLAENLDKNSNNREAYLETSGWTYRIQTWYLYFRKINFPPNPEIHGQWEWAGIYFGDKPFTGSKKMAAN